MAASRSAQAHQKAPAGLVKVDMHEHFEVYEKNKIGKLISWGGDHTVFEYGENQVIKFSLIDWMMGKHGRARLERDYQICKSFLGDYVLNTEFAFSPKGKSTVAIQPKVTGKYLFKEALNDSDIRRQFKEILTARERLVAAGNDPVDLVGRGGVLQSCFSNIFVTPEKRLVIIDATLIEFRGTGVFYPILILVRQGALWRNNLLIKRFTEYLNSQVYA